MSFGDFLLLGRDGDLDLDFRLSALTLNGEGGGLVRRRQVAGQLEGDLLLWIVHGVRNAFRGFGLDDLDFRWEIHDLGFILGFEGPVFWSALNLPSPFC